MSQLGVKPKTSGFKVSPDTLLYHWGTPGGGSPLESSHNSQALQELMSTTFSFYESKKGHGIIAANNI